jgi:hypothetical protein
MGHGENVSLRMDNGPRESGHEEKKVPMEMINPWESLGEYKTKDKIVHMGGNGVEEKTILQNAS